MSHETMLKAALRYANRGFEVFPVHGVRLDGSCDCDELGCPNVGKHPRTPHGFHDATTDISRINRWWRQAPDANVGIRTGAVIVIDVDPRHGGDESLRDLRSVYATEWLDTPTVLTGGGGEHLWYLAPAGLAIGNSAGRLGPGLDVRGDGGYVVVPPSRHASGNAYRWDAVRGLRDCSLRPFPEWALERLQPGRGFRDGTPILGDCIPEGRRNASLSSIAGSMRRRGLSGPEMLPSLLEVNKRCVPPLSEAEVERIAASIGRYPVHSRVLLTRRGGPIHVA